MALDGSHHRLKLCLFSLAWLLLVGTMLEREAIANELFLSWYDNSDNEDGFSVERREGAGAYLERAILGPNSNWYLDNAVTDGASYCYRVSAFNSSGWSDYTNEACGYALVVSIEGSGAGTVTRAGTECPPDCAETYPDSTVVELTALPDADSLFAGWNGGGCGTSTRCNITITSKTPIAAKFAAKTVNPAGSPSTGATTNSQDSLLADITDRISDLRSDLLALKAQMVSADKATKKKLKREIKSTRKSLKRARKELKKLKKKGKKR